MRPFRRNNSLSSKNKYYRPHATRTETLLILLTITLLIIGLLEYSCHVIPQHSGFGSTAEEFVNITRSKLEARGGNEYRRAAAEPSPSIATTSTPLVPVLAPSDSTYSTPRTSLAGSTINSATVPLTAAGSLYLTPKEITTIPESTLLSATHLTPSSLHSVEATDLTPETSTSVRATYLTAGTDTSTPIAQFAPDSTYLSPGTGSVATTDGTYMTPDPTIPSFSTSAPEMVIPNSKITTPSPVVVPITIDYVSTITVPSSSISNTGPPPVVVPVTSNYISTITVPPPSNSNNAPSPIVVPITSDYISTITISNPTASNKRLPSNESETKVNTPTFKSDQKVSDIISVELITLKSSVLNSDGSFAELTTIKSSALVHLFPSTTNAPQNEPTTSNPTSALIETNPADSSMLVIISTFRSVYESTIFPTSSNTIVDKPIATSANSSGTFIYHSNGSVTAPDQITYRQYLIASFLPLFLAIFYAIPWRILENTYRYMEPFYQLRPFSHSTESQAIHLDYESPSTFIIPFKSISRKHFTMFASSLISIIMLVIAPIASQVIIIVESNYCEGTGLTKCDSWGIYPSFARMLEGLLSAIVILILFLIFAGLRRDTGVYSEPLSLIGLAVIYIKTPLSSQAADDNSGLKEDRSRIAVQNYTSLLVHEAETTQVTQSSTLLMAKRREDLKKTFLSKIWEKIKIRLIRIGGFCLLCGILAVVAVYYQTDANTGFNRFMNSQGFGVRFLMTVLGTGTNLLWSRIDEDLRKMNPYHQLLGFNAKPQNSILAPAHMSPYSALIPSLRRKHYLVSWISFCSILSEFLPITLANIPYSNTETRLVLLTCFYLAMGILSFMIIGVVILLFRPNHNMKRLPKKPCTIAARLEYLAPAGEADDSSLLRSVEGLALLGREDRDARIIARGKLYSMGIGEDGKLRIDEDERILGQWREQNNHNEGDV